MTKKLEKGIGAILDKYEAYTDYLMGMAFTREPFIDDFRKLVRLKEEAAYLEAFKCFIEIAHETFRWNDYLEARTTAENTFRQFWTMQHYPKDCENEAVKGFIQSFFMTNIDAREIMWAQNHPDEDYPSSMDTEDDIDTLFLARLFACADDITDAARNRTFCESIGVRYDYEQLHMCLWFAEQITKGAGQYSREEINYSARTTYNRLLNPDSLLWIGVVMGADKDELKAAAEEMESKKTNAAKCGTVRKHVPFDVILQLFQKMMADDTE